MNAREAFGHVDLMQKICMENGSVITLDEWLSEAEPKQRRYYDWLRKQYNDSVPPWYEAPAWK